MSSNTHYSEKPSTLSLTLEVLLDRQRLLARAYTRVHGGGFVTREMLEQTLEHLRHRRKRTPAMLVDLRDVAGYEASCLDLAAQFLRDAAGLGLSRIALVASSSVLRIASQLAASLLSIELRTFEHELHATQWLQGFMRA